MHLLRQGLRAQSSGHYRQAIRFFTRFIQARPNAADAYVSRGLCWLSMDECWSAMDDCNQAIEINPNSWFAYSVRGLVHRKLENCAEATSDHTIAIVLGNDVESQALSYCMEL